MLAQEFYRLNAARVSRLVLAERLRRLQRIASIRRGRAAARACERDSRLPPAELVQRLVPEMFSGAATRDLLAELSGIFGDFHAPGFRLMARSLADTILAMFCRPSNRQH